MQDAMHGDLLDSKSPSFIFEGPDGVNMDGILSDSNDSSSSSAENGLNAFLSVANTVIGHNMNHGNNNNNQLSSHQHQMGQHQSVFHQVNHVLPSTNGHHTTMLSHHSSVHMPEKRKLDEAMLVNHDGQSGKKLPPANGKKTKGRVKIKMEFIDNKLRRYTTFSKRKTGIMKKAYELSTLTGTQVMLLVASETGHVYTFATRKLQPMITSEAGKALIQTCLNSPDPANAGTDQRMCATGFEETDLTYTVNDDSSEKEDDSSESVSGLQLYDVGVNSTASNSTAQQQHHHQQQQHNQQQSGAINNGIQNQVNVSNSPTLSASLASALQSSANCNNDQQQSTTITMSSAYSQLANSVQQRNILLCANPSLTATTSTTSSSMTMNATPTTLMYQTPQGLVYATSATNMSNVFPEGLILNLGQNIDTTQLTASQQSGNLSRVRQNPLQAEFTLDASSFIQAQPKSTVTRTTNAKKLNRK
ncbi:Serum response factor -like protein [Halotydeus destructor]|nr:Serum response factor -like protein [Halotydeus destructor]